jgi:hypothetical protein
MLERFQKRKSLPREEVRQALNLIGNWEEEYRQSTSKRRWEEECVVSMINIYSRYPALKSATLAGQQCTNCITAFVMTFF